LIFSTNGAWYTLRFPASVLFSWVCMFYRLLLLVFFDVRYSFLALRSVSVSRSFYSITIFFFTINFPADTSTKYIPACSFS
jgi:hypothetical protein